MKKKVLIMTGCYIPGVKGGGPIQSIKNLVDKLSEWIDFYIITSDRDLGDDKPFPNIKPDEWCQVGNASVLYTDSSKLSFKKTKNILNNIDYDVMYLNSFFSYKFSMVPILLRKLKQIPRTSIVVAPRGEFSEGALKLKKSKKKIYINSAKTLGLYNNINWHATADTEKKDIEAVFGDKTKISVAYNLTSNYQALSYEKNILKEEGKLRIVFISRINPKKNLKKAIDLLNSLNGQIEFNIYGPIEDGNYWEECKKKINKLPNNVKVTYKGIVTQEEVLSVFKAHHVFLFPTLGENFGHVISEALIGGCPLILSNRTPWRDLERKQIGWDIELQNEKKFVDKIQYCVNLAHDEYMTMSEKAFNHGKVVSNKQNEINNTLKLFQFY